MEIKYKGITRLPSDRGSFNGELEESINITNVAGELRPYITPSTIGEIDGTLLFVHKNSGYEHFISLDGSTVKAYNYKDGEITPLGDVTNIYGENIRKIEGIGNTLIILTNKDVKYALFKNTSYLYLGNEIPFPRVIMSLQDREWHTFPTASLSSYKTVLDQLFAGIEVSNNTMHNDMKNAYWAYVNKNYADSLSQGYLSFPFFVRYAVRMYDGSLIRHSMPFLIPVVSNKLWNYYLQMSDSYVIKEALIRGKLNASWTAQSLTGWSDIIKSVDIFISAPIWLYPTDAKLYYFSSHTGGDVPPSLTEPKQILPEPYSNNLDRITNTGQFYLVHSIPISDIDTAQNITINTREISTIETGELMTDDYLSHDKIVAENSFTYNHRLHLSGIKKTMFPGFKLSGQRCYYEGAKAEATIDIGSQPYIFYPGKASHLTIAERSGSSWKEKSLPLTPHPYLNGSYYIDRELDNIQNDGPVGMTSIDAKILFAQQKQDDTEINKLYVSSHQNPFVFPVESRITLPVGKIIGMASNTEAISQGQFGQFPLFVFTDDGVWALEINQEGRYMARQPVSRDVCINMNILQMDKYIGFITEKGLMILSGSQTECITDIIRENNIRTSKIPISSFLVETGASSFATIYNTDNIEVFLKECSLAYEYLNGKGRIFVINKNFNYSYVFDIESKSWGKIESDFKNVVNNYPDCYVQNSNGQILNLSTLPVSENRQKCLFVTRPISNDNLFSINKLAHRGIFKSELNTVIYASRDGEKYAPIASGTRRLLSMRGSPYKFFKIAVISDLYPTDSISGCVIDFTERYTNRIR